MFDDYVCALNNLHCIDNTYKVIHLIMDLIGLNCCWGGLEGLVILIDLWWMWQITCSSHPSQIAFCTLKVKRFLGMPSDLLIDDSHYPNRVNFSSPQVIVLAIEPNIVKDICMQFSSFVSKNLCFWNGLEVKEIIYVDG
jgi:hypothetical protein